MHVYTILGGSPGTKPEKEKEAPEFLSFTPHISSLLDHFVLMAIVLLNWCLCNKVPRMLGGQTTTQSMTDDRVVTVVP